MSRCSKCNGCTSMWNTYRPKWCKDRHCPEGPEDPDPRTDLAKLLDLTGGIPIKQFFSEQHPLSSQLSDKPQGQACQKEE